MRALLARRGLAAVAAAALVGCAPVYGAPKYDSRNPDLYRCSGGGGRSAVIRIDWSRETASVNLAVGGRETLSRTFTLITDDDGHMMLVGEDERSRLVMLDFRNDGGLDWYSVPRRETRFSAFRKARLVELACKSRRPRINPDDETD